MRTRGACPLRYPHPLDVLGVPFPLAPVASELHVGREEIEKARIILATGLVCWLLFMQSLLPEGVLRNQTSPVTRRSCQAILGGKQTQVCGHGLRSCTSPMATSWIDGRNCAECASPPYPHIPISLYPYIPISPYPHIPISPCREEQAPGLEHTPRPAGLCISAKAGR